jgi:hypothetical protein
MTTGEKIIYGIALIVVLTVLVTVLDVACMMVLDVRLAEVPKRAVAIVTGGQAPQPKPTATAPALVKATPTPKPVKATPTPKPVKATPTPKPVEATPTSIPPTSKPKSKPPTATPAPPSPTRPKLTEEAYGQQIHTILCLEGWHLYYLLELSGISDRWEGKNLEPSFIQYTTTTIDQEWIAKVTSLIPELHASSERLRAIETPPPNCQEFHERVLRASRQWDQAAVSVTEVVRDLETFLASVAALPEITNPGIEFQHAYPDLGGNQWDYQHPFTQLYGWFETGEVIGAANAAKAQNLVDRLREAGIEMSLASKLVYYYPADLDSKHMCEEGFDPCDF